MTEAQVTNIPGGPEQQQRRGLWRSDQEIGGLAVSLRDFTAPSLLIFYKLKQEAN